MTAFSAKNLYTTRLPMSVDCKRPRGTPAAAKRLARCLAGLHPGQMSAISDLAGVPRKIGARARAGRKVNASAYLLLCLVVGIDPTTGIGVESTSRAGSAIVWWAFAGALFLTRKLARLDLRSAADVIGVSAATLSRAECGRPIDIESYLLVLQFLRLPPAAFVCSTGNCHCNTLKEHEFSNEGVVASTEEAV